MLLVWCHLLTGYEPRLVQLFLCKMVPRPPLLVVQVHGEKVSPKVTSLNHCLRTLFTPVGWLRADRGLGGVLDI
jgi:hypothetical protein